MFDLTDEALDQMPLPVKPRIVLVWLLGVLLGWNHRFHAISDNLVAKVCGTVAAVRNDAFKIQINNQVVGFDDVMPLTRRECQTQWISQCVGRDMDLCAEATTTTT